MSVWQAQYGATSNKEHVAFSTNTVYFITVTNQCLYSTMKKKKLVSYLFWMLFVLTLPLLFGLGSLKFCQKAVLYSCEVCCFSQKLTTNASNVLIVQISVGWICWIADVVQLCKMLNH